LTARGELPVSPQAEPALPFVTRASPTMETAMANFLSIPARMLAPALSALLLVAAPAALAQGAPIAEGKQYVRLKNPQPVETGKKIEVLEFFSYGCPHCGDLEPVLQGWLKSLPADVQFRRIPVMFQERWIAYAKIYFTLDALGVEAKLSPAVFTTIHGKGANLWQDKAFFDWAAGQGLDRKAVEEMYGSFAIAGKVKRAQMAAQTYGVQSVPLVVVDGKYMTKDVPTHTAMPGIIDALVAKARVERPKS
jgi:thiol:disulfide interchange protein DsbA